MSDHDSMRSLTPPITISYGAASSSKRAIEAEIDELKALVGTLISERKRFKPSEHTVNLKNSIISEFVPEDGKKSSARWLEQIDQIGNINGWDEKTKIYIIQSKLGG